ncbi:hypothetical protein G9C85_11740 [Halorubellus sp. JP-L1]|uniref:DUF7139 domain-containing protein n=1 Tax=Halorubellus sp. JP-L1 TaxID=2715753 RepID=UPI001408BCCD|nr:hypothetical protein [Halorubellus sp. JP-L1]NHN42293.1 hypothetical protein [Halorubellus sp. JP-L1]
MTSLADAYEDTVGEVGSVRRLYAGTGLFVVGVLLTLVGVVVGGTNVLASVGIGVFEARKIAGVLGGLGVPAVLSGVFTVLPASQRVRGAAAIGASVCVFGVALFWHAYPTYWVTSTADTDLTLVVAAVYVFGAFTSIWTLFTAIVNFKTRNDPGGTIELRITKEGETRVVEVDETTAEAVRENEAVSTADLGSGVGMLGGQPDGDVETQTGGGKPTAAAQLSAGSKPSSRASRSTNSKRDAGRSAAASDGGATTQDITSPMDDGDSSASYTGDGYDAEVLEDEPADPATNHADRYCGNCEHFDYVQTNQGIQPYCGYHDEQMDDMEACDAWNPNN